MADDTAATDPTEPAAPAEPPAAVDAPVTAAPDPVTAKLQELGVGDDTITRIKDDLGVATLDDLAVLTEADLVRVGMKVVQARKLVGSFVPVAPTADTAALGAAAIDGMLPPVPTDESWLAALKAGGVLKVDQSTVISVVRGGLANRVGLFEVPAKLVEAMEKWADANDEQVDPVFFKLRQQLTRRSYAEVFAAIPGLDGNYVTEARKRDLFNRVDSRLWPDIVSFYGQLKAWYETWLQSAGNPAFFLAALAPGAAGVAMPPGMMTAPETGVLRDHADAVNDAINRVFAGTGVQIAAAVAYDANQIKKSLEDPRLPALIGAANRDQMLRQLNVAVSATYPRLEANLTRFVLATMQASDQPGGNEELQFFGALYQLGSQIPWDQLSTGGRTISGIGGKRL